MELTGHLAAVLGVVIPYTSKRYKSYITIARHFGLDVPTMQDALYKLEELEYLKSTFLGNDKVKIRCFKIRPEKDTPEVFATIRQKLYRKSKS